jgi:anthranilate phosphoribosyltransferase
MSGPLERAIQALANRESLSESHAADVFRVVMRGEAAPSRIGGLLLALRVKGETADELAGAARALREAMIRVEADGPHLVDTAGTGGGAVTTFNISTGAALIAAGAGATVAKHGNRSYTSQCGSADVIEALGVSTALDAAGAARVLREAGVAFLFAPTFHPAMRHVAPVRKELGVTTLMNLLGPLANPAGVRCQVVGVADRERGALVAQALARLGVEHALVVHGVVGMDEISPVGDTVVWEVCGGELTAWRLDPGAFGLAANDVTVLRGATPRDNAERLERLLNGEGEETGRAALLLNAAAAIYVSGLARTFDEGVERGRAALESGAAREALARLRAASASSAG